MKLYRQSMGAYQTNCYILSDGTSELIIDPGVDALEWVCAHVRNPIAILNTHGHFDHVWSNDALMRHFDIPLYSPQDDAFLLQGSTWMPDLPPSTPTHLVPPDARLQIGSWEVCFHHFPGHSPGCSMIEVEGIVLSGDFLFQGSIGRWDFPYSDAEAMIQSLRRFALWSEDLPLYPGHGEMSSVHAEQRYLPYWLTQIARGSATR